MITLHHLNNSRSQRILWLLEELDLSYDLVVYQRDAETQLAPESLLKIHPLGKSPVITDQGRTVAESGAIIEYLARHYGLDLLPDEDSESGHLNRYWLHYAEGSLMPFLVMKLIFDKIKTSPMPFFVKPIAKTIANQVMGIFIQPNLERNLHFIEAHLAEHRWFAGEDLSAADFQMSFPLEAASDRVDLSAFPHVLAFLKKVHARPAYQKGLEKGGRYDYASV